MKFNAQIASICFHAAKNSRCSMPKISAAKNLIELSSRLDIRLAARRAFTSKQNCDTMQENEGVKDAPIDNES